MEIHDAIIVIFYVVQLIGLVDALLIENAWEISDALRNCWKQWVREITAINRRDLPALVRVCTVALHVMDVVFR